MSAPANSALDDARKRARRRLLGAIVLALIAAVVVPLFLESDPKPLGPDVQIQIPPIDDAKFQNRLTPPAKGAEGNAKSTDSATKGEGAKGSPDRTSEAGTSAPTKDGMPAPPTKADGGPIPAPEAKTADRKTDAGVDPKAADRKPDTASDGKGADRKPEAASGSKAADRRPDAASDATGAAIKPDARSDGQVAAKKAVAADAKAEPKADAKAAGKAQKDDKTPAAHGGSGAAVTVKPPESPAKNPGTQTPPNTVPPAAKGGPEYVVQLGAFVDKSVAMDLAARAGEHGFSVFLESVTTKNGTVQRVRVGPFASRQAADEAAAKLVKAGFTAVATAR